MRSARRSCGVYAMLRSKALQLLCGPCETVVVGDGSTVQGAARLREVRQCAAGCDAAPALLLCAAAGRPCEPLAFCVCGNIGNIVIPLSTSTQINP
jgi:hypothetical protein